MLDVENFSNSRMKLNLHVIKSKVFQSSSCRPRRRNRKKDNGVEDEDDDENEPKDELIALPATLK